MYCVSINSVLENDMLYMPVIRPIGSFRMWGSDVGAHKLTVSIPAGQDDVTA